MNLVYNLYIHAEKMGLLSDVSSAFDVKTVPYRLDLNSRGFAQFVALGKSPAKVSFPSEKQLTAGTRSYTLRGSGEFVLRISKDPAKKERTEECFKNFWERVVEVCKGAGDDQALRAVRAALKDTSWLRTAARSYEDGTISLAIDGTYLVERPLIRKYLEGEFVKSVADEDGPDFCVVTGRRCTAVKTTHDDIDGVPGTEGPAALISFNDSSSRRRDMPVRPGEYAALFPVAPGVMRGYVLALKHALKTASAGIKIPTQTEKGGVCVTFWGPKEAPAFAQAISQFTKGEDIGAVWKTIESLTESQEELHALFLKGTRKRIAILHYDVLKVGDTAKSLLRFRQFFSGTILQRLYDTGADRKKESMQTVNALGRLTVIRALLTGGVLPDTILLDMLSDLRARDVVEKEAQAMAILHWCIPFSKYLRGQAGLLKKVPVMNEETNELQEPQLNDYIPTEAFNAEMGPIAKRRRVAYLIGRLIALLKEYQWIAHGRQISDATSDLNTAWVTPHSWVNDFTRQKELCTSKAYRHGRGGRVRNVNEMVTSILNELHAPELNILLTNRPLSRLEQSALSWGFLKQSAFNTDYARWRKQESAKKKAKAEAEGQGEDKEAAE